MPGVLVVEAIVQAACFTVAMKLRDSMKNPGVSFMTIDKCKFRKPIIPGDVLNLKVNRINKVKNVQKNSLIKVLKIKNIPFREFKIKNINEETLGELFAYFILETIIIGKLARINPFNQPAVEQVKIITKRFLS